MNLAGSVLLGLVIGWYERRGTDSLVRVVVGVGVLGGFTTFSAWTVETIDFLARDRLLPAVLDITGPLLLGLLAAAAGLALGRIL